VFDIAVTDIVYHLVADHF